jgi:hypothetical protein
MSHLRPMLFAVLLLAGVRGAAAQTTRPHFYRQSDDPSARQPIPDMETIPAYAKRISLAIESATRSEALATIGRIAGLNFVVANDLLPTGTVRLMADTFTVRSALTTVLVNTGVDVMVSPSGNAVLVRHVVAVARVRRLTGIVRDSASSVALGGAVVSVVDSARRSIARAITNDAGRYSMELPAQAMHLRVVRLGFEPRVVMLPRDRGALLSIDVTMLQVRTLLTTTVVNDNPLCSSDVDRRGALSLWEQARAGLLTTVVARDALPADASILTYQRVVDDRTSRVIRHAGSIVDGRTTRPFRAGESPALLAAFGYIDIDSLGGQVFRAPDADVLLDDTFASTHCFTVVRGDARHPGLLGLAFGPARGREKLVDVSGTLWMQTGVPALHSIEFLFTDADNALERAGAGGVLNFHTMANGVAFIKDWTMRLPVIDSSSRAPSNREYHVEPMGERRVPLQTSEAGGVVIHATWPDGSAWTAPLRPFTGKVVEQAGKAPMRNMRVTFEAFADTLVSDSAGAVRLFPMLTGKYLALAVDTSLSTFLEPRTVSREFVVYPDSSPPVTLELPGLIDLAKAVCEGLKVPPRSLTLLGRIGDGVNAVALPRNVSIAASWNSAPSIDGGSRGVVVDGNGRFAVCGIPLVSTVKLTATRFGFDFADVAVPMQAHSALQVFDWTLDLAAMSRLAGQKLSAVKGAVVAETGRPLAGAEIWLPVTDRRVTTDSMGAFLVDSLSNGPTLIQVRRLGFAAQRDKLLLMPGEVRSRLYTLGVESPELESMSVTEKSLHGTTSGYRGFEARRRIGAAGHFLSDSTLRALGDNVLSSILLSRVSGATIVPGVMGHAYLVSSSRQCAGTVNSCRAPTCYVTVYIDGHLVYPLSLTGGEAPPDINFFQTAGLSGVEFYPNSQPTPPEFTRPGSRCGTLLLWSRER